MKLGICTTTLAALALAAIGACGSPAGSLGTDRLRTSITVVGPGSVLHLGRTCPSECASERAVVVWPTLVTLVATPAQDAEFVGWSGDCTGTDLEFSVQVGEPSGGTPEVTLTCTATFRAVTATEAPRTHVLISQVRQCSDTPGGVDCALVPPSGIFDVRFPPASDTEVELGERCYATFDEEYSSLDRGPIDVVTARMPSGRATHDGTSYEVSGRPVDSNPFGATDSLTVTTTAGTVTVPAPSPNLVVFPTADGPTVGAGSAADAVQWVAFGETPAGVWGTIYCQFPGAAEFLFTPPAARAALTASGIEPQFLFTGVLNLRDLTGLAGGPHTAAAGRHLGLTAVDARAIGAL